MSEKKKPGGNGSSGNKGGRQKEDRQPRGPLTGGGNKHGDDKPSTGDLGPKKNKS